jgi:prepilin-type N-terminal cleavage/methylation domain-containing protein
MTTFTFNADDTGASARAPSVIRTSALIRMRMTHGAASEPGMTLVELVVVLAVIAVLMTIAVGSYLGARHKAEERTAQANVRAIVPALTAYHTDHGTYETMTLDGLKAYDQSIDAGNYSFGAPANLTATSYCVDSTSSGETWRKAGPDADIVPGPCP